MSATNTFELALMRHWFMNAAIANVGTTLGLQEASAAGSFYISLHTGFPGEAGSQTTSEANYTDYVRVAVGRGSGAGEWTIQAANTIENQATIQFAQSGGGGDDTIIAFGIGETSTSSGTLWLYGTLTSTLLVSSGVTPQFNPNQLKITID